MKLARIILDLEILLPAVSNEPANVKFVKRSEEAGKFVRRSEEAGRFVRRSEEAGRF